MRLDIPNEETLAAIQDVNMEDYKTIKKRGYDTRLFEEVLDILSAEQPIRNILTTP